MFPILTLWEPSVAMETGAPIGSCQKTVSSPFPTPMMPQMKFDFIWPAGLRGIHA